VYWSLVGFWKWPLNFQQAFCSCRFCVNSGLPNFWSCECMGVGRGEQGSMHFEIFNKEKVVFLVFSKKKQISPLLATLEKFLKNLLVTPLCKKSFRRPWSNGIGRLSFPGTRWYVVTVRDPQMIRDQYKFGKHRSYKYIGQSLRNLITRLKRTVQQILNTCCYTTYIIAVNLLQQPADVRKD